MILFLTLFAFTHCSKEIKGIDSTKSEVNGIYSNKISAESLMNFTNDSIMNYEMTGVNIFIEKDISFSTRSSNGYPSEFKLTLKAELTNKERVETTLLYRFDDEGNAAIIHFDGEHIFATILINSEGELVRIDLPDDTLSTRSLKSWYQCVNKKYQENKEKIQADMLNDIACTFFAVPCVILNAASSIDKC